MAVRVRQSESNAVKTSTLEDDKYDRLNSGTSAVYWERVPFKRRLIEKTVVVMTF